MSFSKFSLIVCLAYLVYYGFNILLDLVRSKTKHLSVATGNAHTQYVVEQPQDLTRPITHSPDHQPVTGTVTNHYSYVPPGTEENNNVLHDIGLEIIGDEGIEATPENLLTVVKAKR